MHEGKEVESAQLKSPVSVFMPQDTSVPTTETIDPFAVEHISLLRK